MNFNLDNEKRIALFLYHTILFFALFFYNICNASSQSGTPPAPGLEEPPALSIDLYLIPMIIITVIVAFFVTRKNINH